jgi:hypothetical protein
MTRVLVVHHGIDLSDQEVDSLRRRGYDAFVTGEPDGAQALIEGCARSTRMCRSSSWRRGWSRRGWRRPASTG